jgi:hypothetical protein
MVLFLLFSIWGVKTIGTHFLSEYGLRMMTSGFIFALGATGVKKGTPKDLYGRQLRHQDKGKGNTVKSGNSAGENKEKSQNPYG